MSRVVQFPVNPPEKLGHQKVKRKRKKSNPEDYGQLNLFSGQEKEAKVFQMPGNNSLFEEALLKDDQNDQEAERLYQLAIQNGDAKEDALCNLGILKSEKDEKGKAIDYLTQALQVNPRHFEAHYNLANVYSDLGNLKLAQSHYEVAIEIEPDYPNSYYNLGLVLISLKKYSKAIEVINKYIDLSPETEHGIANELVKTLKSLA